MPGVRDRTSSTANKPEPISAITPNHNQARAKLAGVPAAISGTRGASEASVTVCESTIASRKKSAEYTARQRDMPNELRRPAFITGNPDVIPWQRLRCCRRAQLAPGEYTCEYCCPQ
jgi:hypothetical protein